MVDLEGHPRALHQAQRAWQAYWAQQAHLLKLAGRREEALMAYDRAIGLSDNAATRDFLAEQRAGILPAAEINPKVPGRQK